MPSVSVSGVGGHTEGVRVGWGVVRVAGEGGDQSGSRGEPSF